MAIKSSFFEGVMEIHLRGLPNTQQQLFQGKKRFFQIMCQVCVRVLVQPCCCASNHVADCCTQHIYHVVQESALAAGSSKKTSHVVGSQ